MSEPVIRTEGLVKEFPVASKTLGEPRKVLHAVTNVSLSVPKGGIFGIVGESGCGKSTLGRCLLRLETITKGSVFFQGRDITNLSGKDLLPLRKNMQMIFQNPYGSFDPKQKIGAALTEVAAVHKMDAAQAQEKIHNLLEQINLPQDALNRIPSEMSGGQLQRLAIARALLLDPAFIVADGAGLRPGCVGPGADPEPAHGPAGDLFPDHALYLPRDDGGAASVRSGRRHVSGYGGRTGRLGRALPQPAPPLHPEPHVRHPDAGPGP